MNGNWFEHRNQYFDIREVMTPWHYKMTLNDRKNPGVKLGTPTFILFPFWHSTHFLLDAR
jgi:hypothetical protein